MRPDPGARRAAERGFTLLEVMVAFVIAGLAIGLLYSGATGGLDATARAAKAEEALSLARSHITAIGRGEAIAQQESSGADGGGFTYHLHVRPVSTRELTLSDTDRANDTKPTKAVLYDITVTESWSEAGHPHDVTLQTRRFETRAEGS